MMPIFIAWTRSFWLGILPALLVLLDLLIQISAAETLGPIAGLIAYITGWSADAIQEAMRGVAAVAALIVAHQRRGSNRPYTSDPRALK